MMTIDEFRFSLAAAKNKDDFVDAIVEFIASIEDPELRLLILAELEMVLLEGRRRMNA